MITIPILGSTKFLGGENVFVIADIGKNFIQTKEERPNAEYLENAKKLIDAAIKAGVDAVKFQTHEVEDEQLNIEVTSPHFKGSDRYSWITRNMRATPLSFWQEIKVYCDQKGIIFFSTPMSRKAASKLEKVGVPLWKVGSGDVLDYVTLDFLISTGKPIIISTGMVGLLELDNVVAYIRNKGAALSVLYCVSQYPCPPSHFNLSTIELFKEKYPDVVVGFSDHSIDEYKVDLIAVKIGARIIEKHFSFSRDLWGADHKASITPSEMKAMIDAIRNKEYENVEVGDFYGDKNKELEGATNQFRPYFNKSLMAGRDIKEGEIIEKEMVFAMRPQQFAGGLPSEEYPNILGLKTTTSLKKYDPITKLTFEHNPISQ